MQLCNVTALRKQHVVLKFNYDELTVCFGTLDTYYQKLSFSGCIVPSNCKLTLSDHKQWFIKSNMIVTLHKQIQKPRTSAVTAGMSVGVCNCI